MAKKVCRRHGRDRPCTCVMGNLYRFVEPVLLLLLAKKGRSYGYDLSGDVDKHALMDAEIERAALYRSLRQLEADGHVSSRWDTKNAGPARRVYKVTTKGRRRLEEWTVVLGQVSESMARFVDEARTMDQGARKPRSSLA